MTIDTFERAICGTKTCNSLPHSHSHSKPAGPTVMSGIALARILQPPIISHFVSHIFYISHFLYLAFFISRIFYFSHLLYLGFFISHFLSRIFFLNLAIAFFLSRRFFFIISHSVYLAFFQYFYFVVGLKVLSRTFTRIFSPKIVSSDL